MARLNYTPPTVGSTSANQPRAVIWTRGYGPDQGVLDAEADAHSKGCRGVENVLIKNETYYDNSDVRQVENVTYCYTDDAHIAQDYEAAGIEVIKIAPLTDEELEARKPPKAPVGQASAPQEQLDAQVRLAGEMNEMKADKEAAEKLIAEQEEEIKQLKAAAEDKPKRGRPPKDPEVTEDAA